MCLKSIDKLKGTDVQEEQRMYSGPILITLIVAITVIVVMLSSMLKGASLFQNNTSNDPQTCQERVAFQLADNYPDPNNLAIAVDMVCEGTGVFIPPTTTRPP